MNKIDPKTGITIKKSICGNCPYHDAKELIVKLQEKIKKQKKKIKKLKKI